MDDRERGARGRAVPEPEHRDPRDRRQQPAAPPADGPDPRDAPRARPRRDAPGPSHPPPDPPLSQARSARLPARDDRADARQDRGADHHPIGETSVNAQAAGTETPATPDSPRAAGARGLSDARHAAPAPPPATPAPTPGAAGDLTLPMRFLAIGLATLALLAVVYPWHTALLRGSFYDPHLLAFVHVNTLGVIAAVILGASYQMLPIVLQTPLAAARLARWSWWLYLPGLIAFVVGLGHGVTVLLGLGGSLVLMAVGLYIWVIARTLRTAP